MDTDTGLRLHNANSTVGFPPHIAEVLSPGERIPYKEFLCRLIQICMVEVGFYPVIEDSQEEVSCEELSQSRFSESVPTLVRKLKKIIEKVGSLRSVHYKALKSEKIIERQSEVEASINDGARSNASISHSSHASLPHSHDEKAEKNLADTEKIDLSSDSATEASSLRSLQEVASNVQHESESKVVGWRKEFSAVITLAIIFDGREMIAVAAGPGFHKNLQLPFLQFIQTRTMVAPTAKMEEYLDLFAFNMYHFVNDIKPKLCYPVMNEIKGLSFDVTSLADLPPELIVEVAKRCTQLQMFRLRASCATICDAFGRTNSSLWKLRLKRDFPQYNVSTLDGITKEDKYFQKYCELCKLIYKRPVRLFQDYSQLSYPNPFRTYF